MPPTSRISTTSDRRSRCSLKTSEPSLISAGVPAWSPRLQEQRKISCMTVIEMECRECGHHWNTSYQRLMVVKSGCDLLQGLKFGTDEPKSAPRCSLIRHMSIRWWLAQYRLSDLAEWIGQTEKPSKQEIYRIRIGKGFDGEIQKSMIRMWKREICMIDGITKETIYF